MNGSSFTPRQRLIVLLMATAVVVVFGTLIGFIVTSIQSWENAFPAVAPPAAEQSPPATPLPPTSTPMPGLPLMPEEDIWSQVQAARLFDQIAREVETLRGLSPRSEVPLGFLDGREMTALLRRLYVERAPEARLLPYTALGLVPDGPVSIQVHQVAGVYVPEQGQLYVATSEQESSVDEQALLAHAYAHALQDQHFDLEMMEARSTTADATLAIRALIEGDATILTALYRYRDLATADWEHLVEIILEAEQPGYGEELESSQAWGRLERFPYREGRRFADALFQAGGWEAMDRAYAAPPRSTEQVLHPERYLGEREDPARVVVPDLSAVLGEDWDLLLRDTLGEFVAGLLLGETLPETTARQAAAGWDGDTFVVWEHADGSRVRVWRTIWADTAEAAEFERALAAMIPQRYLPTRPLEPPPRGLAGQWWQVDAEAICVYRVGRYVVLAHAPDVNTLANVVEVLP